MLATQIRTLLVAVADPANRLQPVIDRAAQLAPALDAQVILFHAAFESYLSGRPFFDSRRLAKSRGWIVAKRTQQLERHAAALRQRNIPVETRVSWEEPAYEAIIRAAIRADAGLVIAGPHEARPQRPPGLRLTDWELLRLCPRPLLLVRSVPSSSRSDAVLVALDPTHSHEKSAALDALIATHGGLVAIALGVELHAVHCIPVAAYALGDDTAANRQRMQERLRKKVRTTLRKAGAVEQKIHVVHGLPETAVVELAERLPAQMLVLGAISRRGLKRFAIGNTAERIIQRAPCDLLIIKPANFKLRLRRIRKQAVILPAKPHNSRSV